MPTARAVWKFATFSLELRILLALAAVLCAAYRLRVFDEALRLFFIHNFQSKFKLPIEIDSARADIAQGRLYFSGARMLAPPKEQDPRWHYSKLMSAETVLITFDPVLLLYFLAISRGKVISAIGIYVDGVEFCLESFEPPAESTSTTETRSRMSVSARKQPVKSKAGQGGSRVVYNFKLIGGEIKKRLRRRKPTQRDVKLQQRGKRMQQLRQQRSARRAAQGSSTAGWASAPASAAAHAAPTGTPPRAAVSTSVPVPGLTPEVLAERTPAAQSSALPTGPSPEPAAEVVSSGRKPIRSSLLGMVSKANSYMKEAETKGGLLKHASSSISRIVTDYNAEVQTSGGILAHAKSKANSVLQATAAKLDTAYQSAKERIKVSYELKIIEFHEKLRGGEPIPDSRDGYVHLVQLTVTRIEVHMRNILPVRLRPLEKTSFLVPEIVLEPKEFAAVRALIDPSDSVGQRDRARRAVAALLSQQAAEKKKKKADTTIADAKKEAPSPNKVPPKQNSESSAVVVNGASDAKPEVVAPATISDFPSEPMKPVPDIEIEFSWLNAASEFAHHVQQAVLDGAESVLHFPVDDLRLRGRSVVAASHESAEGLPGLPICVLVYRLERLLLGEILKDNAGRVINDAVSDWWVGGNKNPAAAVDGAVTAPAAAAHVPPHPSALSVHEQEQHDILANPRADVSLGSESSFLLHEDGLLSEDDFGSEDDLPGSEYSDSSPEEAENDETHHEDMIHLMINDMM